MPISFEMRTILIPVDVSAAVENAVDFSLRWAERYKYDHIILLKTSYESMFGYISLGATYALSSGENLTRQHEEASALLSRLSDRILKKNPSIRITTENGKLPLLRCVISSIKHNPSIELVVLGSDPSAVFNDSFASANIISIARASPVKVLVVPHSCSYKPVENAVVPCDIDSIDALKRLGRIKVRFQQDNTNLMLLNVNTTQNTISDIKKQEWEEAIRLYLKGMRYALHYISGGNIINGILSFTASHQVDLIAALPGRHSFLYYLANKSISEGIYKNIRHAVLILK